MVNPTNLNSTDRVKTADQSSSAQRSDSANDRSGEILDVALNQLAQLQIENRSSEPLDNLCEKFQEKVKVEEDRQISGAVSTPIGNADPLLVRSEGTEAIKSEPKAEEQQSEVADSSVPVLSVEVSPLSESDKIDSSKVAIKIAPFAKYSAFLNQYSDFHKYADLYIENLPGLSLKLNQEWKLTQESIDDYINSCSGRAKALFADQDESLAYSTGDVGKISSIVIATLKERFQIALDSNDFCPTKSDIEKLRMLAETKVATELVQFHQQHIKSEIFWGLYSTFCETKYVEKVNQILNVRKNTQDETKQGIFTAELYAVFQGLAYMKLIKLVQHEHQLQSSAFLAKDNTESLIAKIVSQEDAEGAFSMIEKSRQEK